jgi:crotonobetainyl-CoA:carnitine CoA-transferase CaiB-like acyl-CoA transferase
VHGVGSFSPNAAIETEADRRSAGEAKGMSQVLKGVRVVEVAQWWFVPAAGGILADWGADVVKVEHPVSGDPQRGLVTSGLIPAGSVNFMVEQPNRGKRSIGIDINKPKGLEVLYRLVRDADVFLTNFLPGARKRLRIDVEDIRKVNPKAIYVRGHGQGAKGPDADRGGYDAASFWCRGGIANAITPQGAATPVMQRAAFGDSIGGMTVAGGIAAALFHRERTGEPTVVDVSLLGTAMWVLAPDIMMSKLVTGEFPKFDRTSTPNPIVNSYKTKDDRWLFLNMLQPDRFWPDLCRCIGRPDLVTDERFKDGIARFQNREACVAELDAVFATRTLAEWKQTLAAAEGVWAPMQSAAELYEDPAAIANGYLPEITTDDGTSFQVVAAPVQFDEVSPELRAAPAHAQHTEEVLLALGMSWEEIVAYKEDGAIS